MASRACENLSFGLASAFALLLAKRANVIYANTWPIGATALTFLVARLRRIPVVFSVQDLYPESLIAQGRISPNGRLATLLLCIDSHIMQRSGAVIAVSHGMRDAIVQARGADPHRVFVVPNWIDVDVRIDKRLGLAYRQQQGIPDSAFFFVYTGNIGVGAGLDTVLNAFRNIGREHAIYVLLAGEGSRVKHCQELAASIGDPRILFQVPYPAACTASVLGAADAFLLPTLSAQSLASVPSKLLWYMAAERPVLALAQPHSDLARTIQEARCGWVAPPDCPETLAVEMLRMSQLQSTDLESMGHAGRTYVLRHLSRQAGVNKVVRILEKVAHHL